MRLSFIMRVRRRKIKEKRKSDYKSPGTTQVWVDTGAYRCVVLRGLLSYCSASFLQLVFSGVEAFAVKLTPQVDTPRPHVPQDLQLLSVADIADPFPAPVWLASFEDFPAHFRVLPLLPKLPHMPG